MHLSLSSYRRRKRMDGDERYLSRMKERGAADLFHPNAEQIALLESLS